MALKLALALAHHIRAGDLVGHVFMGHHPAKTGCVDVSGFQRAVHGGQFEIDRAQPRAVAHQLGGIGLVKALGIGIGMIAQRTRKRDHLEQTHAAPDRLARKSIDIEIMLVPHDQLEIRAPDAKPKRNRLQCRIEQQGLTATLRGRLMHHFAVLSPKTDWGRRLVAVT